MSDGRRTLRLRLRGMSQPPVHGTTRGRTDAGDVPTVGSAEADQVVRDAEQSLVAALQESDTALETMHDAEADGLTSARSRRRQITATGIALAVLALLVARRRS